jgi:hypothetical protein
MDRTRSARATAAGLAAAVALVAVGTVAAVEHRSTRHASNAAGDTIELQALNEVDNGSASPSGSPSGPVRGPGGLRAGGLGAGVLGGGILHGDVVVQGAGGKPVTVAIQRGTVTSVGGGHLVVRSSDGFVETWTTNGTTQYVSPGLQGLRPGRPFRFGPQRKLGTSASPTPSTSTSATASASALTKGANVYVLGRTQGTAAPTARLVVTAPTGGLVGPGLGFGRLGPGGMGPGGMGPGGMGPGGMGHRLRPGVGPGPGWRGPTPGSSPSATPSATPAAIT